MPRKSKPSSQPSSVKGSYAESSSVSSPSWEHFSSTSSFGLSDTSEIINNETPQTSHSAFDEVKWADSECQQINKGYSGKVRKSSTFLSSLNWNLMFWKSENSNIHVLGVECLRNFLVESFTRF